MAPWYTSSVPVGENARTATCYGFSGTSPASIRLHPFRINGYVYRSAIFTLDVPSRGAYYITG
jgi:hypothetical protein